MNKFTPAMHSKNELWSIQIIYATVVSEMPKRIDLHHILRDIHSKCSETMTFIMEDPQMSKLLGFNSSKDTPIMCELEFV